LGAGGKRFSNGGGEQIDFEFDTKDFSLFRGHAERGISGGGIEDARDDTGVEKAVLLREFWENGSLISTAPRATDTSSAPIVAINAWRLKLARTFCSNACTRTL
jgi:hypothetical protein